MDIYQQKKDLRKVVKELKALYSLQQKKELSSDILQQIEKLSTFQKASTIMAYWSMDDEVFTHNFIEKWSVSKRIILPVVSGNELDLKVFSGVKNMVAGESFGIPEPDGEIFTQIEQIELILVPGIAFDHHRNRMGRGKAYYDQLLKELKAFKLGICFDFQYFKEVPNDELDIKMDMVITNKK